MGEQYAGVELPNHTQTPNSFYDDLLCQIDSLCELKVTLCLIRQTFGWHKTENELSLSQFQKQTGLSRQGVVDGIELGMKRGTILRRPHGQGFVYRLKLVNDLDQKPVNKIDQSTIQTSQQIRPELVNNVDQQLVNDLDLQNKYRKKERKNSAQPTASQRAAPKLKPHKRDERQRDPRTKYPAIQLVKQLTGYYPRIALYDDIIAVLGDHPDFNWAKKCSIEWSKRGFRMDNHGWVFDWYLNGIPERDSNGRQNGRKIHPPGTNGKPTIPPPKDSGTNQEWSVKNRI